MHVLVTWSSKRGGTEGIGRTLGEALEAHGLEVTAVPVERVGRADRFDAAIVGGALYANRWPSAARRFVNRNLRRLRDVPVWFFSSGPLDDSADHGTLATPPQVEVLAERVGALGHVTFGGRLAPDAKGFPASAMAKTKSGDWRNPERVRAWAAELAATIPNAKPGRPTRHPAYSLRRLLAYAVAGWALCAATMGTLLSLVSLTTALVLHAIAAPVIFALLASRYFRARGARDPVPTALAWTATVALLDLVVVAGAAQRSLAMFTSITGTWLPFTLIFLATWATGEIVSMLPSAAQRQEEARRTTSDGEP